MPRMIEMSLAFVALLILSGAIFFYPLIGVPAGLTGEEMEAFEGTIRNVFLFAYIIVTILCIINWDRMILGVWAVWPVALLVGLAWLSTFWTVAPELTSRRCIALSITTLMGVYLFARYELKELIPFLVLQFAVLVVMCLIFIFLLPEFGLHDDEEHLGTWRGVFFHKNTLGRVMVFGLAVVITAWMGNFVNRKFLIPVGVLLLLVAIGTTSQTTLLGILSFVPAIVAVRIMRGPVLKSALVGLLFLTLVWHGALLGIAIYESVLEMLGRDPSLTGRTEIWAYAIEHILKQPLTGYGYDAFWNGEFSPGANYAIYWETPHSHNSWIEVALAIGLPGPIIFVGITLAILLRTFTIARYSGDLTAPTFIALITFSMLTVGMSEPIFMEKHTIDWVLWVMVIGCARALSSSLSSSDKKELELARQQQEVGAMAHGNPVRMRPIL